MGGYFCVFSIFLIQTKLYFNLKYELQILDDLVKDYKESNAEVEAVIENLKKNCFSINSEESTKLYVRKHQYELIHKKEIDLLYGKSDAILHFLEIVFHKYIDENLPISDLGKHKFVTKYADLIATNMPMIQSRINKTLFNIVTPLFDLNISRKYTVYSSNFYADFWDNLKLDFNILIAGNEFESTFIKFLIANNFNSHYLFEYLTSLVMSQLIEEFNPHHQEEILYNHYQTYNNILVRKGNLFKIDYPEIKPLLIDWLKLELKKCRKKQEKFNPRQSNFLKPESIKIETTLSVGQIAYFFKLLVENGIITNKVQSNILHFISDNFTTKKAESISFSSLNNKYYNIDDSTKNNINNLLLKMLDKS